MYKININKIDFIYKGSRKKKVINTIKTINNIPVERLSAKIIELKKLYYFWNVTIEFEKM